MSWISNNAGETAANFKLRLENLGAKVCISQEKSYTIASASSSSVLRQMQVVTTYEYRGLTETGAKLLRGCESDDTTSLMLYAKATATAKSRTGDVSASVMDGTSVYVKASRDDETGRWKATFTETTWTHSGAGWSSTEPDSYSSGKSTSISKSKIVNHFRSGGVLYGVVRQTKTVKTETFPYQSLSSANGIANSVSDTMQTVTFTANNTTFEYTAGTTVSVEMRFSDEDSGWTVTKTTTTIENDTASS